MSLENIVTGDHYITELVATNPGANDARSEGDDHLRGIKNVLLKSFPAISGPVTKTHTQLNAGIDGTTDATIAAVWKMAAIPAAGYVLGANGQLLTGYGPAGAASPMVVRTGNGVYTITHNLNLDSGQGGKLIGLVSSAVATRVAAIIETSANVFTVNTTASTTGTATDAGFWFLLLRW